MINMIQLSSREEWLAHRGRIGGSEAAAILGLNPWLSNVELWERKTGRVQPADISDKPYIQYGHAAEPLLRELFRLDFPQYKVEHVENNLWTNDKYPFAHASLDGWLTDQDGRRGVWECKTTNILQSMQKEKWRHQMPDNYYCQVLWYMAVIEADFAILKAQLKTDFDGMPYLQTKHYLIEREEVQEDIDYIMAAGARFWEHVKNNTRPALMLPAI